MEKPKVGDKLWLVDCGNRARSDSGESRECEVIKVGRKYFTVEYGGRYRHEVQFVIETRLEHTKYCKNYLLCDSRQDHENETEHHAWIGLFRESFAYYGRNNFTLDQLRDAAKILGIALKATNDN